MEKLPPLLRELTSKRNGDNYCLNYLHSFRTRNKLESRKKVRKIVIPSEDAKILEFNQSRKCDKARLIIFSDLESLIVSIDGCKNNREKSYTTKVSEHIPSGFSISTI